MGKVINEAKGRSLCVCREAMVQIDRGGNGSILVAIDDCFPGLSFPAGRHELSGIDTPSFSIQAY